VKLKLLIYFQEDQKHTHSIIVNIYFFDFISINYSTNYFLNVLNVGKLNIKKRENGNIYNRRKSVITERTLDLAGCQGWKRSSLKKGCNLYRPQRLRC